MSVNVTAEQVKELRERTGAGMMDCRKALVATGGDINAAIEKLRRSLGGIKEMQSLPDCLFVIDVGYEQIAVSEAKKLGIPVIAVVDTNNSPDGIDCVIPGNDDATRAIKVYAETLAQAIIDARGANTVAGRADEFVEVEGEAKAAAAKPRGRGGKPAAPKKETKVETKVRRPKVESPEAKE